MNEKKIPRLLAGRVVNNGGGATLNRGTSILLCAAWLGAVVFGMGRVWRYENTPGAGSPVRSSWPARAGSVLNPTPGRATLLLFAHPRCPCTRASLHELTHLLARSSHCASANIYVLFYKPQNAPNGWEKTDLYDQAGFLPGVTVLTDTDGRAGRQFGATTSGQVLLFDGHERLLFSGGITGARGHEGNNRGEQALLGLLSGASRTPARFPVFGCALQNAPTP